MDDGILHCIVCVLAWCRVNRVKIVTNIVMQTVDVCCSHICKYGKCHFIVIL